MYEHSAAKGVGVIKMGGATRGDKTKRGGGIYKVVTFW